MIFPAIIGVAGAATGHMVRNAQEAGAIAGAESRAYARGQIDALRYDTERVLMITEALWELLKQKHGYTDEQLLEQVRRVDGQDGRLDGRVERSQPTQCRTCGRNLSRRRPTCIYCGAVSDRDVFAR